jgi:hypothetical protein
MIGNITGKRTLRTPTSERFLAIQDGQDAAAVDLRYLPNGTVSGTVIVLRSAGTAEEEIPRLLASLDEDCLPDVDLQHGTLTFTVVWGEIVANYEASRE